MSIRQWRHATGWPRVRAHPRLRPRSRGQALVELALILPIILLLLAAAIDQGWAIFHVTRAQGGSSKTITGYFTSGFRNSLLSVHCPVGGCPRFFGNPVLQLTN